MGDVMTEETERKRCRRCGRLLEDELDFTGNSLCWYCYYDDVDAKELAEYLLEHPDGG